MSSGFKKMLGDALTEDDNMTFCIARILIAIACFTLLGVLIHKEMVKPDFSFAEMAQGLGYFFGGCGAFLGGKAFTQKDK